MKCVSRDSRVAVEVVVVSHLEACDLFWNKGEQHEFNMDKRPTNHLCQEGKSHHVNDANKVK